MIHDHQIYEWLKNNLSADSDIQAMGIKAVEVADYPEIPGPSSGVGGLKQALPRILICKGDQKNTWSEDVNSDSQLQTYYIKIKYARLLEAGEKIDIVMASEMAKIMDVLKGYYNLNNLGVGDTAAPLRLFFTGEWDATGESLTNGSLYICLGYFNIKVFINKALE